MSYIHPAWIEYQRKRFARPDVKRWMRPDAFGRNRCGATQGYTPPNPKFYEELYGRKFDPNQPRVPAGNSDGGQWTSGENLAGNGSSGRNFDGFAEKKPDQSLIWIDEGAKRSRELQQVADQITTDARPVYDKADAALLSPKGLNADASSQKLRYRFEGDGSYLAAITVTNEDRTIIGRMAQALNNSPVHIGVEAKIETADGISNSSFEIRQNLPPGGSVTIPWAEFGLMRGPGTVSITATNKGSLITGIVAGAVKAQK